MTKEYAVWNKQDTYIINAESEIRAIQSAIEMHSVFVPASGWNVMAIEQYSDKAQSKIRQEAITI